MTFGWPYPKRKAHLAELAASPSPHTQLVPFQGKDMHLKIYSVPIDLPKYRLDNGRTYAAQAEFLATHPEYAKDFFTKDLELDEAQRIQHALLDNMVNEEGLLDYFKKEKQAESLILTHEGFVVNGNRRLCAMRKLLELDASKYSYFEHVNIVILPPADEKDIDQLEAELQVKPDIKATYTWYALALMIKKRRDEHKLSIDYLSRLYQKETSEVEELIELLNIAEIYLKEIGSEGQYHKLQQTFYAFKEFRKSRTKAFKCEAERDCFQKLSFGIIEAGTTDGRLYDIIPSAAKYFNEVVEQIRDEFSLTPKPMECSTEQASLFGQEQVLLGDVFEVLSDKSKIKEVTEIVSSVVEAEKRKAIELGKANYIFNQVKKANTLLVEASHMVGEHQEKTGIEQQVQSIEASLVVLRSWLNG